MDSDYKPIPVAEAQALAERYDKSIVIVFAWDNRFALIHTTTYGVSEAEKDWAAKGGEIATKALGGDVPAKIEFEDYRITKIQALESEIATTRKVLLELANHFPRFSSEYLVREMRSIAEGYYDGTA